MGDDPLQGSSYDSTEDEQAQQPTYNRKENAVTAVVEVGPDRPNGDVSAGKLVPPFLPPHWIRRNRLHQLLSSASQSAPTFVTASPGAGKTVLLADWTQATFADGVAWLSADSGDNDPGTFCRHVIAALDIDSTGWESAETVSRQPGVHDSFIMLQRALAETSRRVLVVDDVDAITNAEIIEEIVRLTAHSQSPLRLVLAGRSIPAVQLRWLVVTNRASAVSDADLRFTMEESAALVALVAGNCLRVDQLTTLTERCEGWAAGIYLAALGLAASPYPADFVERFPQSCPLIEDYLEHEVILRSSPELVRFLLQTSVLNHLTPELCEVVSARSDASKLLDSLVTSNLFIVPIDRADRTYRYHELVADFLDRRRDQEDVRLGIDAHLSAGSWFEQHGDPRSAAHHFSQGHDHMRAAELMVADLVQPFDGGLLFEDETVVPLVQETAPDGAIDQQYTVAAALLGFGRVAEGAQLLRQIVRKTAQDSDSHRWEGRIEFLWAVHAERRADPSSVLDHWRATTELMKPLPPPAATSVRKLVRAGAWAEAIDIAVATRSPLLAARAKVWLDRPEEALAILCDHFDGKDRADAAQPALLALVASRQGQLKDAYRLATASLQQGGDRGGHDLIALDAQLALADVHFERNELEDARRRLEAAIRLCRQAGAKHWLWAVEVNLVRLELAQQRPGDALARLGYLRHVASLHPPCDPLVQKLNCLEVDCRIALGDLEGTLVARRALGSSSTSRATLARIDLFCGRPESAVSRLAGAPAPGIGEELRRLVLLGCADLQRGHTNRAQATIQRALDTGRAERFVRPFLEEARQVLPVLHALVTSCRDPYVAYVAAQAEELLPTTPVSGTSAMLEALTDRERELLTYLPSHLHLREIAPAMYVSLNTVKTHLKNTYRKLGASSRSEAVAIARGYGLL